MSKKRVFTKNYQGKFIPKGSLYYINNHVKGEPTYISIRASIKINNRYSDSDTCKVEDCNKKPTRMNYCDSHYFKLYMRQYRRLKKHE